MYVTSGKRLTTDGARKMMATAMDLAKQAGAAVSVAITDAGGHLILLERMDGGRFHTVHSATTKAVCAASNKRMTSARGAQAHIQMSSPTARYVQDNNGLKTAPCGSGTRTETVTKLTPGQMLTDDDLHNIQAYMQTFGPKE